MSEQEASLHEPSEEHPIFVYGTLQTGFRNHKAYLAEYSRTIRPAKVRHASLWHIEEAGYPVITDGTGDVYGELVWLNNFKEAIPGMDLLEDYDGDPETSTYVRKLKTVYDAESGVTYEAYIYWFEREVSTIDGHVIPVPDGNWRRFMEEVKLTEGTEVLGDHS